MKVIFILILFFLSIRIYAQKIGLVYNFNPTMGYTYAKGILKAKPVVEKDIDYNIIKFIEEYLSKNHIVLDNTFLNDFDFNKLFKHYNKPSKILSYSIDYGEKYDLKKLIVINKSFYYNFGNPMEGFYLFSHDYGIVAFKVFKRRSAFYYNFTVSIFDIEKKVLEFQFGNSYFNHKSPGSIYDDNFLLIDNSLIEYYIPKFEKYITDNLDRAFIQKPLQ